MSPFVKILALIFAILFLVIFITLAKERSVKPFYSTLWLIVSIFLLSFVLFEKFYQKIAVLLGIENATFLIIVGLISFLLLYVLYLSIKISELMNRVQELISHSSILELEIRKLKEKNIEHNKS